MYYMYCIIRCFTTLRWTKS